MIVRISAILIVIPIFGVFYADAQNAFLSGIISQFGQNVQTLTDDVEFYLFTRNVSNKPLRLNSGDDDVVKGVQIKLIVHGWGENRGRLYYAQMTGEYLRRGNYNVVQVDWSIPARAVYTTAVHNTVRVGKSIGKFVMDISENNGVPLGLFHLLGHSLGAHVAGIAGKEVLQQAGGKIGRITGLDPAGPLYEDIPTVERRMLTKDDANMVDVVHTDGGVFGYRKPIGSVDFFPNGGVGVQPGCLQLKNGENQFSNNSLRFVFCSHTKSYTYFIRSISTEIEARKCDSWVQFQLGACKYQEAVIFGEDAPPSATGKYYFRIK